MYSRTMWALDSRVRGFQRRVWRSGNSAAKVAMSLRASARLGHDHGVGVGDSLPCHAKTARGVYLLAYLKREEHGSNDPSA